MFPSSTLFHYPILQLLADGKEHTQKEFRECVIVALNISEEDQKEMVGKAKKVKKVTSWVNFAVRNLRDAGFLSNVRTGVYTITQTGKDYYEANSEGFVYTHKLSAKKKDEKDESNPISEEVVDNDETSQPNKSFYDILEEAYRGIQESLPDKLLEIVKQIHPSSFEKLVRDLIAKIMKVKLDKNAVVTQYSKDGGIDGYINVDSLGIKKLCCFQAKRWEASIGVKPIRELVGALAEMKCDTGIFVTTSYYSKEAKDYSAKGYTIILLDGKRLADLMIESGIGVCEKTYIVKDVDTSYLDNL